MAKSFSLIVASPGQDPVHYRLTGERVAFGRAEDNRIVVEVKAISSRHCRFLRAETGGYRVVDLGSTNGTRVNGQRVMDPAGVMLKNGDRLLFGETVEAHFFEAVEADHSRDEQMGNVDADAVSGWMPVPVWMDASQGWDEDQASINPVAAAVARQEAGTSLNGRGS